MLVLVGLVLVLVLALVQVTLQVVEFVVVNTVVMAGHGIVVDTPYLVFGPEHDHSMDLARNLADNYIALNGFSSIFQLLEPLPGKQLL